MGIINATPDSFFSESRVNSLESIVEKAIEMANNGADWIDIGGESTRPGATLVTADEEMKRVIKAIESIRDELPNIGISLDTRKAEVARNGLIHGADLINDISSLSDPQMLDVVIENKCPICIMHMQGSPENMQHNPSYGNAVREVGECLMGTSNELIQAGVKPEDIINDPGIGFGKNLSHNIELISSGRDIISDNKMSLMWGVSRKKIFADLLGRDETKDRLAGTLGVAAMAPKKGVDIVRVHDVAEHYDLYSTMIALE